MDKKLKRFMSLVLAFIMILSSNTFVLADGNSNVGAGGGAGGTIVNHSGGDDVTTGYKIELLWIPLSDEVWSMKPSPEKTKKVNEAWNSVTEAEIQRLGKPVLVTNDEVVKASKGTTATVFRYGDSVYGLGTRGGVDRKTSGYDTVTLKTYKTLKGEIAKSLNSVSPELSSVISNYNPSKDLPVYVGSKSESNVSSDDLKNFFMPVRPQENKNENTGDRVGNPALCALVNYMSTMGGEKPEDAIYFQELHYDGKVNKMELPFEDANCFDTGIRNGEKGNYKLILEPFYRVQNASGFGTMFLTARDFIYVSEQQNSENPTAYPATTIGMQPKIFKQLAGNVVLEADSIWGLKGSKAQGSQWSNHKEACTSIRGNYGGGLAIFDGLDIATESEGEGSKTHIGTVAHMFLPGSLNADQKEVVTTSMEYIGKKGSDYDVREEVLEGLIELARIVTDKAESTSSVYNTVLNQGVLLNGVIKIPGLMDSGNGKGFKGTYGYAERYAKELREVLDKELDIKESTRVEIKSLIKSEIGLDIDNPSGSAANVNMTDLSLGIYLLSRIQLDGLEANGEGWGAYDSGANRWREIISYGMLMDRDVSSEANDVFSHEGAYGISQEDIGAYGRNEKFDSMQIGENKGSLKGYQEIEEGAKKAQEEGALDSDKVGQISLKTGTGTQMDSVFNSMSEELGNGLVRMPIAMGTSQLHLTTDKGEGVKLEKGMIGSIVESSLKALTSGAFRPSNPMVQSLSQGLSNLWKDKSVVGKEYPASLSSGTLSTKGNLANVGLLAESSLSGILNDYNSYKLFQVAMPGDSFLSTYTRSDQGNVVNKECITLNSFGINMLINTGVMGALGGYELAEGEISSFAKLNPELNKSKVNGVYTNEEGAIVVPSWLWYRAKARTAEGLAEAYKEEIKGMTKEAVTLNDAVFSNNSNNSKNLVLAVNNQLLQKSLSENKTEIKTSVTDGLATTKVNGDYGIGYVVWDTAIPIDIQLVTEADGKIVPIEAANGDKYDSGIISNVFYSTVGTDKALQLQKYYTVTDNSGKEVTLEVEEAVVKSAGVYKTEDIKSFYEEYTKAYNSGKDIFEYDIANSEDDDYYTMQVKRTKLSGSSDTKSNVEAYVNTHTNVSPALRYIVSSGAGLGMPTTIGNLTGSVYNTIDVTLTGIDKTCYLANPQRNRVQLIVKVKATKEVKQYNIIEGLEKNWVEVVEPKVNTAYGQKYFEVAKDFETDLGFAIREDLEFSDAYVGFDKQMSIMTSTVDVDATDFKGTFSEWVTQRAEDGISNKFTHEDTYYTTNNGKWVYNTGVGVKPGTTILTSSGSETTIRDYGDGNDVKTSVPAEKDVNAIYVRYVEKPPVYEIYRDSNGNEKVYKRKQDWNGNSLKVSTGSKIGEGVYDNPVDTAHQYYPIMAVAANINFNSDKSTDVIEVMEDGKKVMVDPVDWKWVDANLRNTTRASKNTNSTGYGSDVQILGTTKLYYTNKNEPITISSIIKGAFGSGKSEYVDFGYSYWSSYNSTKPTQHKELSTSTGEKIYLINSRVASDKGNDSEVLGGVTVPIREGFAKGYDNDFKYSYPSQLGSYEGYYKASSDGGMYESINKGRMKYSLDYRQPKHYTLYLLYEQDNSEADVTVKNSFYTVLPQDMITRAVAYKDLARQYYQREEVKRYKAEKEEQSTGDDRFFVKVDIEELALELKNILSEVYSSKGTVTTASSGAKYIEGTNVGIGSLNFVVPYTTGRKDIDWGRELKSGKVYKQGVSISKSGLIYKIISSYETNKGSVSGFYPNGDTISSIINSSLPKCTVTEGKLSKNPFLDLDYLKIASEIVEKCTNVAGVTESSTNTIDSYWQCNFNTWYTLYISAGDSKVRRVDYEGKAQNRDGLFEPIKSNTAELSENEISKLAVTNFGPTGNELGLGKYPTYENNFSSHSGYNVYYKKPSSEEGKPPTEHYTTVKAVTNGSKLANYGNIQFGIQGYQDTSETTPATVGNVEGGLFFSTSDYNTSKKFNSQRLGFDSSQGAFSLANPKLNSTSSSTYGETYWRDYYHYYNDYNFYVLVWRGMEKPNLSSAALESEQDGVATAQREALNDLTSGSIGAMRNGNTNGFSDTPRGVYSPKDNSVKIANYWAENMYPAYVNMGAKDTSLRGMPMKNGYSWYYKYSGNSDLVNSGEHYNPDTKKTDGSIGIDVTNKETVEVNGSDLTSKSSYTEFKGNLLVDSLIDKAGVGSVSLSDGDIESRDFTLKGGERYRYKDLTFSKTVTTLVPNTWTTSNGNVAQLWVNWYPYVKMRYQTIDNNMYYTPSGGGSPVETKEAYTLSKNQSSMVLNSAVDIGFSRGEGTYNGQSFNSNNKVPNALKIRSTQWSTHANAISNFGKAMVLPGGAIYTLTTGSISKNAKDDALARSKVAVRYWKPYVPDSMVNSLVVSNNTYRYGRSGDSKTELYLAKQRYKPTVSQDDLTFTTIVQAVMQTLNNTKIGLDIEGIKGNAFDSASSNKYKMIDTGIDSSTIDFSVTGSGSGGLSGKDSKANSISLDTVSYQNIMPTYYRVWSDTEGNVFFGWKQSSTPPKLSTITSIGLGTATSTEGYVRILAPNESSDENYTFSNTSLGNGIPYGVDYRTKLITNYVRSIERGKGYTVDKMSPSNSADSNHLMFDMAKAGLTGTKYQDSGYGGTGNGLGNNTTSDGITNYNTLASDLYKLANNGWGSLVNATLPNADSNTTNGKAIGYKWLKYNSNRNSNSNYNMKEGWYNEASDGFGVVMYGGIIEVGFGGPQSNKDNTQTPVRTSIIDPHWQKPHKTREDLFTDGKEAYFYTQAVPNAVFIATIYGKEGGTYSTKPSVTSDGRIPFIGIHYDNKNTPQWVYLDKQGLSWLYRSRTFIIGNGSVMDLN